MAHIPLKEFYKKRLECNKVDVKPEEMGVSCRSINGGYVTTGAYRKAKTHGEIIERRRRVNERLKKYT